MPKKQFLALCVLLLHQVMFGQYMGSASVTQGLATITASNLYTCTNGRVTDIGTITANDASVWTVPASVNFTNNTFPFASNLYNPCTGALFANEAAALAVLNGSDIVTVDGDGEVITAYVFADNYFEMYINGIPVGKDNVPFTQFNSNIIRFKVKRPFTIAMHLVDWEEHLGVGCELNNGFQYHMGDGGMVAVFKDANNQIIAKTGNDWKAQTYYTAPIIDLTCPSENGHLRLSANCSTQDANDGTAYYGLHWPLPVNWYMPSFNDSIFPLASTFTNATIGVNNKPAYTNFTNVFDDPNQDATFIWSSNIILDNDVLVRYTVASATGINEYNSLNDGIQLVPNPASETCRIDLMGANWIDKIQSITIHNMMGQNVMIVDAKQTIIDLHQLPKGLYLVRLRTDKFEFNKKLIVQ